MSDFTRRQKEDAVLVVKDVKVAFGSTIETFDNMIGKTMCSVTGNAGSEHMVFESVDGDVFRFFHAQDCCESVCIESVDGDLTDLIGDPLWQAEEVSSEGAPEVGAESHTWTFYKFSTTKGSVTVRWLGTSNGYYSESVAFEEKLA